MNSVFSMPKWSPFQARLFAPLKPYMTAANNITDAALGLTWTYCEVQLDSGEVSLGLAQTSGEATRTLPWSGSIQGKPVAEIAPWLTEFQGLEATLALAAMNALINTWNNPLCVEATRLEQGNLAVFEHFKAKLARQKVVVIGRYPGLEKVLDGINYQVLERRPGPGDLPDSACEQVLPEADWVFITGTSLINHTLLRLCELSERAVTVLMGPSVPWLPDWAKLHVDFIAGVQVLDAAMAKQVAKEGGGTRMFDEAVVYQVANISGERLQHLKAQIAETWAQREALKASASSPSDLKQLEVVDAKLSRLDSAYKRLWDAQS